MRRALVILLVWVGFLSLGTGRTFHPELPNDPNVFENVDVGIVETWPYPPKLPTTGVTDLFVSCEAGGYFPAGDDADDGSTEALAKATLAGAVTELAGRSGTHRIKLDSGDKWRNACINDGFVLAAAVASADGIDHIVGPWPPENRITIDMAVELSNGQSGVYTTSGTARTATSVTSTTVFTDTNLPTLTVDELVDFEVLFITGAAAGEARTISGNTAGGEITVDAAFTLPSAGDEYWLVVRDASNGFFGITSGGNEAAAIYYNMEGAHIWNDSFIHGISQFPANDIGLWNIAITSDTSASSTLQLIHTNADANTWMFNSGCRNVQRQCYFGSSSFVGVRYFGSTAIDAVSASSYAVFRSSNSSILGIFGDVARHDFGNGGLLLQSNPLATSPARVNRWYEAFTRLRYVTRVPGGASRTAITQGVDADTPATSGLFHHVGMDVKHADQAMAFIFDDSNAGDPEKRIFIRGGTYQNLTVTNAGNWFINDAEEGTVFDIRDVAVTDSASVIQLNNIDHATVAAAQAAADALPLVTCVDADGVESTSAGCDEGLGGGSPGQHTFEVIVPAQLAIPGWANVHGRVQNHYRIKPPS